MGGTKSNSWIVSQNRFTFQGWVTRQQFEIHGVVLDVLGYNLCGDMSIIQVFDAKALNMDILAISQFNKRAMPSNSESGTITVYNEITTIFELE